MALPSSGELSFSGLNNHIRRPDAQALSLNDAQIRGLAQKGSGTVAISDLHGKWAGTRLTCGYQATDNVHGFRSGIIGAIEGEHSGSALSECCWLPAGGLNVISLMTVANAAKPTSQVLRVTDDNFNLIGAYTLGAWSAATGARYQAVLIGVANPFPSGSKRWFTW